MTKGFLKIKRRCFLEEASELKIHLTEHSVSLWMVVCGERAQTASLSFSESYVSLASRIAC